jgi:hypothetical protein
MFSYKYCRNKREKRKETSRRKSSTSTVPEDRKTKTEINNMY